MTEKTPQVRQCKHCEYSHLCPVAEFARYAADTHDEIMKEYSEEYGDDDGTVQRMTQDTIRQLVETKYPECTLYAR